MSVTDVGAPERLLGGRYRLAQSIGTGGMAEVYVGTDVRLGRTVAVKVLRADLAREPAFHSRFRREAQAAASLSAPQIVSVYDTGADDEDGRPVPWIVMELVEGRTLKEVLSDDGRLMPTRALEVVADVCTALQVAHDAGIVHRDVKPGNVMLSRAGDVKVMDFGIARAAAGSSRTVTETAAVMGTAAYLSPEQARGEHVDPRSDLYSTGCLLYELLTGSPPFTGDSAVAVAYQHVREDPVKPSEWDRTLSAGVDAVVLKAMAKNPANRYQSATEMAEDLQRAARGRPVLATPVLVADEVLEEEPAPVSGRPGEVAPRTRGIVYAVVAVALIAYVSLIAAGLHALLQTDSGGIITAPDLVDPALSQSAAQSKLAANGLQVGDVQGVFSTTVAAGRVIRQEPRPGIVVDDDRQVDLVISQGPERSVVPSLVGRSQDEAASLLREVKLTVNDDTIFRDGNIEAGTVLETIPAAGSLRPIGQAVQLVVASGEVSVPGVIGATQDQAITTLRQAGLSVGIRFVEDTGTSGVVRSQFPQSQDSADRGSDVIIEVTVTPAVQQPVAPTDPVPSDVPSDTPTDTPTDVPSPAPS